MRILTEKQEKLFWSQVMKTKTCWLWYGSKIHKGYGRCKYTGCKERQVHRISYILHYDLIPEGMTVNHKCNITSCVNPQHLELMTALDNYLIGPNTNVNKTHCPQGHSYTESNTYKYPNGRRECRVCARLYKQAYKIRKKTL